MITPLTVFLAVWAPTLGLFSVPLIRYTETSTYAWVLIYGSIVCFAAGCAFADRVYPTRTSNPQTPMEIEWLSISRLRVAWVLAALLGLVGFAAFVRAIDAVAGWQVIFTNFEYARAVQVAVNPLGDDFVREYGLWRLLTYSNTIAFLVWTVGLRLNAFKGSWRVAIPLGPLSLVPYLFTGDRSLLLTTLVWLLLFHLVWRPLRNAKRVLAASGAAVVLILAAFLFIGHRAGRTIDRHPEIAEQLSTRQFDGVALPYLYVTANFPTFSGLISDPIRPSTFGEMTFLPIAKVANVVGLTGPTRDSVTPFYPIPFETYNAVTWLGVFFLDFGVVGCLALPLLAGLVLTLLTRRALEERTLLLSWTASVGLIVVAFSPLLNRISSALTWQFLLSGFLLVPFLKGASFSPRQLGRRLERLRPRQRALTGGVAAVLIVLATTAALLSPERGDGAAASIDLAGALEKASAMAGRVLQATGSYPTPYALASQLRTSDPSIPYKPMETSQTLPNEVGVVEVFSKGSLLVLRAREPAGGVIELQRAEVGGKSQVAGPRLLPRSGDEKQLVFANGDFEEALDLRPWLPLSEPGVTAALDSATKWTGRFAFRLSASGARIQKSVGLTQIVRQLPARARGSRYDLQLRALTRGLNRPVPVELRLDYEGGGYEFFRGGLLPRRRASRSDGIPAGTSRNWKRIGVSAVARRRLRSVQVFAADSGPGPLRGSIWIDAVRLRAVEPGEPVKGSATKRRR
ncbi:MAG: O-antigen polymerase [Thermoleophilaceae bacterium]